MARHRIAILLAFGLAAGASYALADPVSAPDNPRFRVNAAPATAKGIAHTPLRYAALHTPRVEGITKTSVESRFGVQDNAVGEAGFLCGLLPHPDTAGAAAAFGHDPDGRFVGAKLRIAF